ncbi:MAG: hypothetical protein AAFR95_18845 [Bacteroidota bacterium]
MSDDAQQPDPAAIGVALQRLPAVLAALSSLPDELERLRTDANHLAAAKALLDVVEKPLRPHHSYLPKHAAVLLGIKPNSLNSGKYSTLPRGTSGSILGIWIMAAQGVVSYDEAKAYVEARRSAVLALTKKAEKTATGER